MATGDAISQLVVERTHKFDVVRNGRFLVFGVFIGVSNPAPFPYFSDFVTLFETYHDCINSCFHGYSTWKSFSITSIRVVIL